MKLYLGPWNQPHIELAVRLNSWQVIDCLIDTGFSSGLALPSEMETGFQGLPVALQRFTLADGSKIKLRLYRARVKLNDIVKDVNVVFTPSRGALAGIEFLQGFRFVLDLKKNLTSLD